MRNFTPDGVLKLTSAGAGVDGPPGELLAAGRISPVIADPDAIAALQALSVAADTDGLALAQAPVEEESLELEEGADNLIPPRQVTLSSAADLSAITFTIEGFDEFGNPVSEELAGPDEDTVTSEGFFSAVTAIVPDASDMADVQAGWATSSQAFPLRLALSVLPAARQVTLTSEDDLSTVTFEVQGLDENGATLTEQLAGPNAGSVQTTNRFSQVFTITPDSLGTGTVSVGWPGEHDVLYAPDELMQLSHIFLRNTAATREQIELFVQAGGETIPWRTFSLDPDETASVLYGEPPLPLGQGQAIEAAAGSADVIAYLIYGARRE